MLALIDLVQTKGVAETTSPEQTVTIKSADKNNLIGSIRSAFINVMGGRKVSNKGGGRD